MEVEGLGFYDVYRWLSKFSPRGITFLTTTRIGFGVMVWRVCIGLRNLRVYGLGCIGFGMVRV